MRRISMRFGCHVSISNGYTRAAQEARRIGGRSFQYFPKNPRNLSVKTFDRGDASACREYCRENNLLSIAHTPYPTELTIEETTLKKQTKQSLYNDLEIAEACGSIGVVVHFGKYKGKDPLQGYKNMIQMLNEVLSEWEGKALILLENNAGQGVKMGTTLDELVKIRHLCKEPNKIGYCLDTCHAFASTMWNGENLKEVIQNGEKLDYFSHLRAIHLNDSMYPTGSYRDRHANVGKGEIGEARMKEFLKIPFLSDVPIVLETPSSTSYTHQDEIKYLEQLVGKSV
jgi:deoxyribonuclease-4